MKYKIMYAPCHTWHQGVNYIKSPGT